MAKKDTSAYVLTGTQLLERKRNFIPCTLSFDVALNGGIPLGATVVLGGVQKLGKTTLALQCAANAQKLYGCKVFYFNIEGRIGHQVLSQVQGLSLDDINIINPTAITNKDGEVVGHEIWYGERWWDEIGECIQNNPRSIIIIDSVASLTSEKEVSEEMGYQDRGGKQKLEAQFHRKFGTTIVPSEIVLFLLTHIQANTSGYGPHKQAKIGNALKHQGDVILFGKNFTKWADTNGKILGQDMVYNVECSANGMPYGALSIPLRYGHGIDIIKDAIDHCVNWDVIQKGGAWFTLPFVEVEEGKFEFKLIDAEEPDDEKIEKAEKKKKKDAPKFVKLQGENSVRNWFLIRPEHFEAMEQHIRKIIFG